MNKKSLLILLVFFLLIGALLIPYYQGADDSHQVQPEKRGSVATQLGKESLTEEEYQEPILQLTESQNTDELALPNNERDSANITLAIQKALKEGWLEEGERELLAEIAEELKLNVGEAAPRGKGAQTVSQAETLKMFESNGRLLRRDYPMRDSIEVESELIDYTPSPHAKVQKIETH